MKSLTPELALALLDELPEPLALLDARAAGLPLVFANRALEQLRARSRGELALLDLATLLADADAPADAAAVAARLAQGEAATLQLRLVGAGGIPRGIELRLQPLGAGTGEAGGEAVGATGSGPSHVLALHRALEGAGAEPRAIAREDRLTGLCHADWFRDVYRRDFAIAQREGRPLALFLVDIDSLGLYNDTFGRQAGDSTIRRVGRTLLAALRRASDLVARLEGGRFVALATGMEAEAAQRHAETLAARVRELHVHHPRGHVARFVTVSVGVATLVPGPAARPEQLYQAADRALAGARSGGRNRAVAETLPTA